jgi:hypothetical protein
MKILPIGTLSFVKLPTDNAVYVDKTKLILNLITRESVYFLSRLHRFGKPLLISTFVELFKGNNQLFEGDMANIIDK